MEHSAQWHTAFDYDLNTGDTYSFRISACENYDASYFAIESTLVAPAGDFAGAHEFSLKGSTDPKVKCASPPLGFVATADGTGPIGYADGNKNQLGPARSAEQKQATSPP